MAEISRIRDSKDWSWITRYSCFIITDYLLVLYWELKGGFTQSWVVCNCGVFRENTLNTRVHKFVCTPTVTYNTAAFSVRRCLLSRYVVKRGALLCIGYTALGSTGHRFDSEHGLFSHFSASAFSNMRSLSCGSLFVAWCIDHSASYLPATANRLAAYRW